MRRTNIMKLRITEHSLYWIKATIFQGERLLKAEKIEYRYIYTITCMEEQFFLNAVNKSIRWLKDSKSQKILVSEINTFLSTSSMAKLVRNKREHDDEFFGSKQKEETLSDASDHNSKIIMHVGQSVTVHRNGRILLGGTVDVEEVIDAAKVLEHYLRTEQHTLWKNRFKFFDEKRMGQYLAPEGLITK